VTAGPAPPAPRDDGLSSVAGRPDFFRFPFINPEVTLEDVDTVLDLPDRYGSEVAGGAAVTGAGRASP
jgi:hypothetical protein